MNLVRTKKKKWTARIY